jgi:hypothetical protein
MKIYQMNCCDYYAAENMYSAICGILGTGISIDEALDETLHELTDEESERLMFTCENGVEISFKAELENRIKNREEFPDFFASTEY